MYFESVRACVRAGVCVFVCVCVRVRQCVITMCVLCVCASQVQLYSKNIWCDAGIMIADLLHGARLVSRR